MEILASYSPHVYRGEFVNMYLSRYPVNCSPSVPDWKYRLPIVYSVLSKCLCQLSFP